MTNTAELNLGEYESETNQFNSILTQYAFFPLPFSPNGKGSDGSPAQFCEDFNETLAGNCGATAASSGLGLGALRLALCRQRLGRADPNTQSK